MTSTATEIASLLFESNGHIVAATGTTTTPDIVAREGHRDALTITQHPVETGASITDHAFKMPAEVRLEYGFSNSSIQALGSDFDSFSLTDLVDGNLGEGFVKEIYAQLLALQSARTLCQVVTSKRLYKNMLIASIETETTAETAYAMHVSVTCQEVIIASTVTSSISSSDQSDASSTAATVNSGQQQLSEVSNQTSVAAQDPSS
ncbi:phage baseplate protein [Komagataeibacter oboediens]|uniref:phage baseplate protein n=1 Tax=Komagataeibacter oboediens TaxID=65958 RepID=UPI000237EC8E|nr:hypothetical protein [Komagataeibacter oboediens]